MDKSADPDSSDDEAFQRFYTANFTAVLHYALRRVRGPDDAADLVADTFLVAWRRRDDMPTGEEARPWLYGVARLVLANHRRGERRRDRLGERLRLELRAQLVTSDPMDGVVQFGAARQVLGQLRPADREVLELTAWEQLTPGEIAVALSISPEAARARLSRARIRMRSRLSSLTQRAEDEFGHGPPERGHQQLVRIETAPKEDKA